MNIFLFLQVPELGTCVLCQCLACRFKSQFHSEKNKISLKIQETFCLSLGHGFYTSYRA